MIDELISRVFASRNATHIEHWRTKSYAAHIALGEFYDGVIDNIDGIVEAYQGAFDLVKSGLWIDNRQRGTSLNIWKMMLCGSVKTAWLLRADCLALITCCKRLRTCTFPLCTSSNTCRKD